MLLICCGRALSLVCLFLSRSPADWPQTNRELFRKPQGRFGVGTKAMVPVAQVKSGGGREAVGGRCEWVREGGRVCGLGFGLGECVCLCVVFPCPINDTLLRLSSGNYGGRLGWAGLATGSER